MILVALSASTLAHPGWHGSALVPVSNDAGARLDADLAAGVRVPADLVCEVDGPLVAVHHDPDPVASGLSGIIVVSGLPIVVPTSVPVQVGDTPGDHTAFLNLTATPPGYSDLLGSGASVSGLFRLRPDNGAGRHVRCVADFFLLEAGHPPLIGMITDNGPGGLYVMGVRVVPHSDPRLAPFVRIHDLAGHPIPIAELPPGALVTVNGDFDEATGIVHALTIELDALIPSAPGEDDHLSILRAEARTARLELRARGFSNNATATVSIYDFSAGVKGALFLAGVPVSPVDGAWDARVDFAPVATTPDGIPTQILAETTNGGSATAFVNIRG